MDYEIEEDSFPIVVVRPLRPNSHAVNSCFEDLHRVAKRGAFVMVVDLRKAHFSGMDAGVRALVAASLDELVRRNHVLGEVIIVANSVARLVATGVMWMQETTHPRQVVKDMDEALEYSKSLIPNSTSTTLPSQY